tara:strand:+ start:181 stop:1023 length:843 start_codon:yes stop_codon:yes gene_type:complete
MNIRNAILEATNLLSKKGISSSQLDSEILMAQIIQKDRKFVILNLEKKLKKGLFDSFKEIIYERSCGKPIAYLTSKKNFWSNEFIVNKNVLIPRPDTEIIIEEVLRFSKYKNKLNILEIGVGSGCILLTILNEKRNFRGVGIDISKKCLELSKINASNIGLKNQVKFIKSDVDNFNYGKYDLIVSNPPYIDSVNLRNLDKEVTNFEPRLALDGGLDGLSVIRKVVKKSSELIKKNGKLILEIGYNQKKKVKQILKDKGFYINKVLKDYANNDRCIVSTKK